MYESGNNNAAGTSPGIKDEVFWNFWEAGTSMLQRLCLRWMGGDVQETHDAMGAAMIRAYEAKETAPATQKSFFAWTARITRNICIDLGRGNRRHAHTSLSQEEMRNRSEPASQAGDPENDMVRREQMAHLLEALNNLPLRIRTPMVMRCFQDKPYSEIAQEIRVTDAHARKLVQQGRDRIRYDLSLPGPVDLAATLAPEAWILGLIGGEEQGSEFDSRPLFAVPTRMQKPDGTSNEEIVFVKDRPGRLDQKLVSLLRYVRRFTSGWKKKHELAEVYLLMGNQAEAIVCLEQVLRRQPHRIDHRLGLAHQLDAAGKSSEAAILLGQGSQYTRRYATQVHLQAWQAFYNGEITDGVNLMKHAVISEPVERSHHLSLGRMLLRSGRSFEAWEAAYEAMSLDNTDAEAIWLARTALRNAGATHLLAWLEDHLLASHSDSDLCMGISLRKRLRNPDASASELELMRKDIRHYGQVTRWSSEWADIKARYFWSRGKAMRCLSFVKQYAIDHEPCADAQLLLLRWYRRAGKYQSAASACPHILAKFHDQPQVLAEVLRCLTAAQADIAPAVKLAEQYPGHHLVAYTAANALLEAGELQKARRHLDKLTGLYPGHARGWLLKAKAEFLLGDLASAEADIRAAWNTPVMAWSPFLAAEAALVMGRLEEKRSGSAAAEEWREMAARIAGGEQLNHPALSYHFRSLALSALGDRKGASACKEKSIRAGIWFPEK